MTPNSELILSSYEMKHTELYRTLCAGKTRSDSQSCCLFVVVVVVFDASVKLKVGEPSVSLPSPVNTGEVSESSNMPACKESLPTVAWQVLSASLPL